MQINNKIFLVCPLSTSSSQNPSLFFVNLFLRFLVVLVIDNAMQKQKSKAFEIDLKAATVSVNCLPNSKYMKIFLSLQPPNLA